MAKLIYAAITSLDGYTNDRDGNFEWAAPADDVHAFVNDIERSIGTYLYGRRMYETMRYWENPPAGTDDLDVARDYTRVWQAADKIVFSRTLESVTTARTRLESTFDRDAVRAWKAEATADLSIGGSDLAAQALRAGLVDELHVFMHPIVIGGGTNWLPTDLRLPLRLLDERRFESGVVHMHFEVCS
jgi:dihydrofolate reductase